MHQSVEVGEVVPRPPGPDYGNAVFCQLQAIADDRTIVSGVVIKDLAYGEGRKSPEPPPLHLFQKLPVDRVPMARADDGVDSASRAERGAPASIVNPIFDFIWGKY